MDITINNEEFLVEIKSNFKFSSYYIEDYKDMAFDIVLTRKKDNIIKYEIGILKIIIMRKNKKEILLEYLDEMSKEIYDFIYLITNNNNLSNHVKYIENNNFAYIKRLYINPEYRNKNIGCSVLKYLENYLKFFNINHLYLFSYPTDCNYNKKLNIGKEQKRLNDFYIKNGFKILNKNNEDIFMYKNL